MDSLNWETFPLWAWLGEKMEKKKCIDDLHLEYFSPVVADREQHKAQLNDYPNHRSPSSFLSSDCFFVV